MNRRASEAGRATTGRAGARVPRRAALRAGAGVVLTGSAGAALASCAPGGGTSVTASPSGAAPRTPGRPVTATPPREADWRALAAELRGTLVRPKDAAYDEDHRLYNMRFDDLRPAALAHVTGEDDVRACLAFARRTATVPVIRGGGHSYAGWSSGDKRLVIDTSRLNSVRVDGKAAEIGAGAKLIDVYSALARHGRTLPGGSCPSVGIAGLTLGGGHGVLSRSMGLTCDNLIAATIVTPDGRTRRVSASSEPELFWALRGAGGGMFGVVTSLRFATHPLPAGIVTGYLSWPWSNAAAVVTAWQAWGPDRPDHLWSALHLDCTTGTAPTVTVPMLSTGPRGGVDAAADALVAAAGAQPTIASVHGHAFLDAMFDYAGCSGLSEAQCHIAPEGSLGRETYTARSDFYDAAVPAAGVQALLSRVAALAGRPTGGGKGSVALTALGGAINRRSPTATAFPHRSSRVLAQYIASDALSTTGWLDDVHGCVRRYANGGAYANYTDPTLSSWRTAYYGRNAARLTALKSRLDPTRLFTFPQSL